MNKAERLDEQDIEQAINKHCVPNHQEIGRIALERPKDEAFVLNHDDVGSYLEVER